MTFSSNQKQKYPFLFCTLQIEFKALFYMLEDISC